MWGLIAEDAFEVDLSAYDPPCIAGTIKKYLRELANPVVPVESYAKFIEASSEYTWYTVQPYK